MNLIASNMLIMLDRPYDFEAMVERLWPNGGIQTIFQKLQKGKLTVACLHVTLKFLLIWTNFTLSEKSRKPPSKIKYLENCFVIKNHTSNQRHFLAP